MPILSSQEQWKDLILSSQKHWKRFNTFFTEALERFNTSTYEYTYTLDDKPCKIFIKIKKGTKILSIYDQDNVDITHDILPYVGP